MNNPLVSIIIITYNSSKYVLETLQSAYNQTYQNIELIVTDDGSKDNTVEICRLWLNNHADRFVNAQIITVEKNTGTSANCNRGFRESKGAWIKFIAGDDILLPNCLSTNVKQAIKGETSLQVSDMEVFSDKGVLVDSTNNYTQSIRWFAKKNQKEKTKAYLRNPMMINVPTYFVKRSLVTEVGGYDEDIKLLEDTPFFTKCLLKGYDIGYVPIQTVSYRKHDQGVMNSINKTFVNNQYACFVKYSKPNLKSSNLIDLTFKLYRELYFVFIRKNLDNTAIFKLYARAINVLGKLA